MAIILPLGIASAHVFPADSENAFARGAGVAEMAPKRVAPQQSMHVNQKVRPPVALAQSRSSPNQFKTPCEFGGAMIFASNENIDPVNRPLSRLIPIGLFPHPGRLDPKQHHVDRRQVDQRQEGSDRQPSHNRHRHRPPKNAAGQRDHRQDRGGRGQDHGAGPPNR